MIPYWPVWKYAMERRAKARRVKIPSGFHPEMNQCGDGCRTLMRRLQANAGLAADGILGPDTRRLLRPYVGEEGCREAIVRGCRYLLEHEPEVHYRQIRPAPHELVVPLYTDCSGSTLVLFEAAGAPDPSGYHFNGAGNTTTFLSNARRTTRGLLKRGDLVCWPGHVCIVYADPRQRDPLLFSHGQENGPKLYSLSVEDRYQYGTPAYLDAFPR